MKKPRIRVIEEPEPGSTLLCSRVEDAGDAAEGSIIMECSRCRSDVWVGVASQQVISVYTEITCLRCLRPEELAEIEGGKAYTTKAIVEEVNRHYE